jgi:hypothetical protein
MRFPLVCSGGDETPIAWSEWLFAPIMTLLLFIMTPLLFIFLLVMAFVSIPLEFVYRLRQQREEMKIRPRLGAAGRFLEWAAVEAKLRAGEGTLIVEHLSPKGPIREWWTEDDLIAPAPVSLPRSLKSPLSAEQLHPMQEYAATCARRYTDVATGAAKLTDVPVPLARRLDPAKYVVVDLGGGMMTAILLRTGRKLADKFPTGKVVTLVAWLGEPLLFAGDAEYVFLAGAESVAADETSDINSRQ